MKSKTLAIAGSIAALSFAAVPLAHAADVHHKGSRVEFRLGHSRDAKRAGSRDKRTSRDHSRHRDSRGHSRDKTRR